jgi:hypothetical protein
MEWWILLGLAAVALGIAAIGRLRRLRRTDAESEPKNIYPLW